MIKAIHGWCGQIIPDVSVKAEVQSDMVLALGTIPLPTPPTVMIIDAPYRCPKCNHRLYKKDIILMIGDNEDGK